MFYTWLELGFAVLLCAALWLNRNCWRTFALSVVVAAGVFTPVPWGDNVSLWYFKCFLVELLVICGSLLVRSPSSWMVIVFAVLLATVHLLGALVGPSAGVGPYRITIPFFEAGELLACVLFSRQGRDMLQARRAAARQKRISHV